MGVACLPLAVGDRSGGGGALGTQERLSLSQSRKEAGKVASTDPQRSQLGFVSAKLLRLPTGWQEIQSGRASGQAWVSLTQNQCYVVDSAWVRVQPGADTYQLCYREQAI